MFEADNLLRPRPQNRTRENCLQANSSWRYLALRRQTAPRNMLEALPIDTLSHVLDFLDIPSRVKLARSNLTVQQRVYRERSQAWEKVDLSAMNDEFRVRLTDRDLLILLTRCNAQHVVKELDLSNCVNILGNLLAPLANSDVLEVVTLFSTGADNNLAPFYDVLRTCFRRNLKHVFVNVFSDNARSRHAAFFLRNLRDAKRSVASCSTCCNDPVVDPTMQLVPRTLVSPNRLFAL